MNIINNPHHYIMENVRYVKLHQNYIVLNIVFAKHKLCIQESLTMETLPFFYLCEIDQVAITTFPQYSHYCVSSPWFY